MKVGTLRLGLECNHKCIFCTISDDPDPTFTKEEAKSKIDSMIKQGVEIVNFTGGEPTIRDDLVELFAYAKQKGVKRIELQTNAILLSDKEYLNKLIDNGLFSITVSFHSHIKDIYEKITCSNDFEKAVQAIKYLLESNVHVTISHVFNKLNYKNVIEFLNFFEQFQKYPNMYLSLIRPNGRTIENLDIVPKIVNVSPFLKKALKYLSLKNIRYETEGFPLCYLHGYFDKSGEIRRTKGLGNYNETQIYESKNTSFSNLHEKIYNNFRAKSNSCQKCLLNNVCSGVWQEYANIYGTDELKPFYVVNDYNNDSVGVGPKCNNACIMCTSIVPSPSKIKELSYEDIVSKIDDVAENSDCIYITGGEPTIRKDIFKILSYAIKNHPKKEIKLISNGRMFSNEKFFKYFSKFKKINIITELYGSSPKVHDYITQVKGSFEQSLKGIQKIHDAGFDIELRMVVNKLNFQDLPELGKLYSKKFPNAERIVIFPIDIIGNAYVNKEKTVVTYTEMIPYIEKTIDNLDFEDIKLFHTPYCVVSPQYRTYVGGITVIDNRVKLENICDECMFENTCPRIWKTYSKIVGTSEFKAIKKSE
jgi:MoaA/NifB/PqqE/SkfB family radical SAM enzyme